MFSTVFAENEGCGERETTNEAAHEKEVSYIEAVNIAHKNKLLVGGGKDRSITS